MTLAQILPFLTVVAVITATPGPDTVLVVRNTLQGGRRDGLLTAIGCSTGLLVWGGASSLGLAAVLRASATLFDVIRLAGGLYLVWLGIRTLWGSWNVDERLRGADGVSLNRRVRHQPFMEGLLADLLNPKAAAFFTALLPQFLNPHDNVLRTTFLLAAIAAAGALVGLSAYACIAAKARVALMRPPIQRLLDRVAAAVLVGLGIRMLVRQGR